MAVDAAEVLSAAEALHTEARVAINQYRTKAGKDLIAQVRAMLSQLPESTTADQATQAHKIGLRAQLTECWVVFEEQGVAAALAGIVSTQTAAAELDLDQVVAAAELQKAVLLGRAGDQAAAITAARTAMTMRAAMPPNDETILLLTLGNLTAAVADYDAARAAFAEAATVAQVAGMAELEFMALHNGGHLEYLLGDLPRALTLMEQADEMDIGVDRSIAYLDRGRTLLDAGLLDDASAMLRSAADLAEARHSWHDLAEIQLESARCELLRGRHAAAVALARRAKRGFNSRGENAWRCRALMVELEAKALLGTEPAHRARLAGAVYSLSRSLGDKLAAIQAALLWSEALVEAGDLDAVAPVLAEAASFRDAPQISTRLHHAYVMVGYHTARGQTGAAKAHLTAAARELIVARQSSASIDLRTALSVHGVRLAHLDWRHAIGSGRPEEVLERVELWRGAALGQAPVRPARDGVESALLARLRNVRTEMRTAVGADLAALDAEATVLYQRIRTLSWKTVAAKDPDLVREDFPLDQLATALGALDTSLVVLLTVDKQMSIVVMRPSGEMALVPGPDPGEVAEVLARVRADLIAQARLASDNPIGVAVDRSLATGLRRLDSLLLGPADVAGSPIVIAPFRELGLVPWSMLPSRRGVPTTVSRTATAWVRSAVALSAPIVTAIAGPELAHAGEEVAEIAGIWQGTVVGPEAATGLDLLTALEGSDLVHVAAHGDHQYGNPLFSSIRLADGAVFAHEFEGRPLRASQVVLSACEAGTTTLRPGGEELGLTPSLLELGVGAVVAPVTVVPDELASEVMGQFHRELAAGADSAAALAVATANTPVLGASFTLFGAPWRVEPTAAAGITSGGGRS